MATMNLAIKPKGKIDPIVRINVGVKQSLIDEIMLYATAYKEIYEQEITDKDIINDVLTNFFVREKSFQEWKKLQRSAKPEKK